MSREKTEDAIREESLKLMDLNEYTDLSLQLVLLGKRFSHEYLRTSMSSGMNMVYPPICLPYVYFLGDNHRGILQDF